MEQLLILVTLIMLSKTWTRYIRISNRNSPPLKPAIVICPILNGSLDKGKLWKQLTWSTTCHQWHFLSHRQKTIVFWMVNIKLPWGLPYLFSLFGLTKPTGSNTYLIHEKAPFTANNLFLPLFFWATQVDCPVWVIFKAQKRRPGHWYRNVHRARTPLSCCLSVCP